MPTMRNWKVENNGSINCPAEGPDHKKIGVFDRHGNIWDCATNIVGKVSENGRVLDKDNNNVGWIDSEGVIYDDEDNPVGQVTSDGEVCTQSDELVGWVDFKVHIGVSFPNDDMPMHLRAAAAAFLMIFRNQDPG